LATTETSGLPETVGEELAAIEAVAPLAELPLPDPPQPASAAVIARTVKTRLNPRRASMFM
jgi:hypothetical protein